MKDMKSFLSFFSHEARAHLGLVRNYAEILLSHPPDSKEQRRDFLAVIRDESDYLIELLTELVDMERIETGVMEWRIAPTSIASILQRSLLVREEEASTKGITIESHLDENLPMFSADEQALSRAFTHLVQNAIRFSRKSGIITLRAARSDNLEGVREVRITIEDQGIGIPAEVVDKIFDKFFKGANSVDGSPEGSGIGLPFAQTVIGHFQGRIEVESAEGEGSRFIVFLPAAGC